MSQAKVSSSPCAPTASGPRCLCPDLPTGCPRAMIGCAHDTEALTAVRKSHQLALDRGSSRPQVLGLAAIQDSFTANLVASV